MTPAPTRQLEGCAALVTGAGNGIGLGIARILAERGAAVCAVDIDGHAADSAVETLREAGCEAISCAADVTDAESLHAAVRKTLEQFGHIDICVPNAGVVAASGFEARENFTAEDWEATRDVNVFGVVNTVDAVVPHMKDRRSGKIVIISSQGGRPPRGATLPLGPAIIPYLVSKAATIQLTHHLAVQLGQFNINVNAVCPGTVWTPMWERIAMNRISADATLEDLSPRELFESAIALRHPIAREQTSEDVGRAVAFFASEDAAQITGQALNVNGGAVMD